ncbi:MAG: permease, partial [Acidobacteria bacterium]|nr:permease [Acidobacteriota bacterium]
AGTVQNILEPPGGDRVSRGSDGLHIREKPGGPTERDPDQAGGCLRGKLLGGIRYAFKDLWGDIAGWFVAGMLLAGLITILVPEDLIASTLGSGLGAMLLMLLLGIPLYICATASTPIAAALILKGVSPGAALVFLLVGPATNIAGITVLTGILGRRAVAAYLGSIAAVSILAGLILDGVYQAFGVRAEAAAGQAAELIPPLIQFCSAIVLVLVSAKPLFRAVRGFFGKKPGDGGKGEAPSCRCGEDCEG